MHRLIRPHVGVRYVRSNGNYSLSSRIPSPARTNISPATFVLCATACGGSRDDAQAKRDGLCISFRCRLAGSIWIRVLPAGTSSHAGRAGEQQCEWTFVSYTSSPWERDWLEAGQERANKFCPVRCFDASVLRTLRCLQCRRNRKLDFRHAASKGELALVHSSDAAAASAALRTAPLSYCVIDIPSRLQMPSQVQHCQGATGPTEHMWCLLG